MDPERSTRFRIASALLNRRVAVARYVALKPVRARLVQRAQDWRWSSVAAHLAGRDDDLVSVAALLDRCAGRFADPDFNRTEPSAEALSALRAAGSSTSPAR